ncbi:PaaI family thioesterase [Chloracidobacterium thermophilum]|uniref:PaaI family thioesterase n=1 Tax=Chloracidobacterium thermophilum TaxID=458033 RepID=UPI000738C34F|nr:PaaI family thioesterase [Chloracidobacterium thermophilum]
MTALLPRLSVQELNDLLHNAFPLVPPGLFCVETVEPMRVRVRMRKLEEHIRPGGTLSGPALFTLADTALYMVVLAMCGPVLEAVTSEMTIHYLRRPAARDAIGEATLLRLGQRSAVGEVLIRIADEPAPVAHAVGTYALPRNGSSLGQATGDSSA